MNNNPPHVQHFILIDDRGRAMNINYDDLTTNMVKDNWMIGVELDNGERYYIKTVVMQEEVFYSINRTQPLTSVEEYNKQTAKEDLRI